jgi:hypothetical protein
VREPDFRPRHRFSPLAREITVILIVKAIVLYVIWLAFFSTPAARSLDAGGVARSLISAPAVPPSQETDSASGHGAR